MGKGQGLRHRASSAALAWAPPTWVKGRCLPTLGEVGERVGKNEEVEKKISKPGSKHLGAGLTFLPGSGTLKTIATGQVDVLTTGDRLQHSLQRGGSSSDMCREPIPDVCHPELDMGCPTLTRHFQKTLLPTPKAKGNVPLVGYSWHMIHWKNIMGSLYPQSTPFFLRSPQAVPNPLGSSESASVSPFLVADPEGCILQRLSSLPAVSQAGTLLSSCPTHISLLLTPKYNNKELRK